MRKFYTAFLLTGSLFFASFLSAQSYVNYVPVVGGLSAPIEVVNAADGTNRLFIVQQNGVIRIYDAANGGLRSDTFLYIRHRITYGGEQGLLSMAFHPAYENNGYFYLYYNNLSGDITVARYRVSADPNRVDSLSGIVLLNIPKPFSNHNGGHLQFAADSTLYFATGDGGSGNDPNNYALNRMSRLGKMLRLKVYTSATAPYFEAPDNNPFIGDATYDPLIWARGLRNPFRWSFDRLTGDMWIGDVGQGAKEEVNFRPASSTGGENYGWRCYEGSIRNPGVAPCDSPNYYPPIFDYNNPAGGAASSVVGGYVYRGSEFPSLFGYYITTDVYTDSLYLIKPNGAGGWNILRQRSLISFVVSFGEGEDGTIYAVSQSTGFVYKVVPSAILAVNLINFTARKTADGNDIQWSTNNEDPDTKFVIEYSPDGSRFTKAGETMARGNGAGNTYSFIHRINSNTTIFYRLAIVESSRTKYSSVVKINGKEASYRIYPTVLRDGKFYISSNEPIQRVQLLNNNGSLVHEKSLHSFSGQTTIQLPALPKGIYVVRLIGSKVYNEKIFIE